MAVGQVPPDKVDFFFTLAKQIAADLVATPIGVDELRRTLVPYVQYIARASTGNTFWLSQLAGASFDDRRIAAVTSFGPDISAITPEVMQQTAAKYLKADTVWLLAVKPKPVADAAQAPATSQ